MDGDARSTETGAAQDELLTIEQAATELDVSPWTLTNDGPPAVLLGTRRLIRRSALADWTGHQPVRLSPAS